MKVLLLSVLLMLVFKSECHALDGFGYEVLIAKMECLEQKIETLRNETIRQEEQRKHENSKILQGVKDFNEQLVKQLKEIIQQETQRHRELCEQNSTILQTMDQTNQRTVKVQNLKPSIIKNQRMDAIGSCAQVNVSGKYSLKVSNDIFEVYCEQELYGGRWIVIQNRFDGSVDFYRNWTEYRNGFGNVDGEFWLGLQKIHLLTSSRNYELLVHLEDFEGVVKYARYQRFAIGGEAEQYALKTLGTYSGTAGNSLVDSETNKFSTYDRDNDAEIVNCAEYLHSAWWYEWCSDSNINGKHQNSDNVKTMYWYGFKKYKGLKISKMVIREL